MKAPLKQLEWIANLTPENCPGGVPKNERAWRDLMNRIVMDVRRVLRESDQSDVSEKSDPSDKSDNPANTHCLLPAHGGYRKLRSFQVAEIIFDGTKIFCDRFVSRDFRTRDQMVQAARSGRQNIAEGSVVSGTSKKSELKLTNVAKGSQEELLLDYEDFLRNNNLRQWHKDDPEALAVRQRYRDFPPAWFQGDGERPPAERLDPYGIAKANPEIAANTLLCLINQTIYLLKRQIEAQERSFLKDGGFTERLYRSRQQYRRNRRKP